MCDFSPSCESKHKYAPHGVHICSECHCVLFISVDCKNKDSRCDNGETFGAEKCYPACGRDPREQEVINSLEFDEYVRLIQSGYSICW